MRRRKASRKDGVAGSQPAHRGTVYADGVTTRIDSSGKISAIATVPPSAQVDATYVTMSSNSTLNNERVLTAGTGISVTDNGANSTVVVACTVDTSTKAPKDEPFVTIGNTSGLSAERALTAGTGISITDGGANSTVTVTTNPMQAPKDAQFLTLANTSDLSAERLFTPGTDLSGVDGGANSTYTLNHSDSGITGSTLYFSGGYANYNARGHLTGKQNDPYATGEGLVMGHSSEIRGGTSLTQVYYSTDLAKMFGVTAATNGLLLGLDKITMEMYTLATYSSKALNQIIYSPHASSLKLYISYGSNTTMSVNASTYAIVTSGIAKNFNLGGAIRTSDGVLYGGENGGGSIHRIDTTTDTAVGTTLSLGFSLNSGCRKAVSYCPINDSIYAASAGNVGRIPCTTNVAITPFTPAGLSGASGACWTIYSPTTGRIYTGGGSCTNIVKIDPSSDAQEAAYAFPPGAAATGSSGATLLGRYLYVGGNIASAPSEILIFDTQTNTWIGSLNTANGTAVTGNSMAGVQGTGIDDTYLIVFQTASQWYYFGGRGIIS